MQPDVALDRIREVRPERRMGGLILGELRLRRERQVRNRTDLERVADSRSRELGPVERIPLEELRQVIGEPSPLRGATLVIAPSLRRIEPTHPARVYRRIVALLGSAPDQGAGRML